MEFARSWTPEDTGDGEVVFRPLLRAYVTGPTGLTSFRDFVVDSGADFSMAPRRLATELGIPWSEGDQITLTGISKRKQCRIEARIHEVQLLIRETRQALSIPMCFASTDAPCLLGRDGFFDHFQVLFDKPQNRTVFRTVEG